MEARALEQGVALDSQAQGSGNARQRLEEIAIRLTDLAAERAALVSRGAALARQIAVVEGEFNERQLFAPRAPVASVVWQASPEEGAPVSAGDEVLRLLDCENRFIEVAISERYFERIGPGADAIILLKGSDQRFSATVEAVRGAGAQYDRPSLAAAPVRTEKDELNVLLRLDPVDVTRPGVAEAFCDVGRTAEVRFDRTRADRAGILVAAASRIRERASDLAAFFVDFAKAAQQHSDTA